jgi:hypothetical protein
MGKVDAAAMQAQWAMTLQAAGWAALLASGLSESGTWADRLLSSIAMACLAGSLALIGSAFDLWCGR